MNRISHFAKLVLLLAAAAQTVSAATFTVSSAEDSGLGTLRQAILDANASQGPHRIEFRLPGNGVRTIAPGSALPELVNPTTIDGYSQPGSKPNTLPWGNDAVLLVRLDGLNTTNDMNAGLTLATNNCVVRGLIIVRFNGPGIEIKGSRNVIAGNWIGVDFDGVARGQRFEGVKVIGMGVLAMHNLIGGDTSADRNVISGNFAGVTFFPAAASWNSVQGNFIGTDPSGRLPRGNTFDCVDVMTATNIQVLGNVLGASTGAGGSGVSLLNTSGILIQSNLIGVSVVSGDIGHFANGISAQGVTGLQIGGLDSAGGNRIGCNRNHGLELQGCSGVLAARNIIGTASSGAEPLGNLGDGVLLTGCNTNQIGPNNQIVYNGRAGVAVSGGAANQITANYIFDNGGLGIDLGNDGLTPNDSGDFDLGANQLQNYPVLTSANSSGGSLQIQGSLQSEPASVYRVEFFASRPWDPLGIAEGQVYLGSTVVTTDSAGECLLSFSCPDPEWLTADDIITATATDTFGNTSEFSTHSSVAKAQPPSLWVSREGNVVTVYWPSTAAAAGYKLESTNALDPAAPWEPVTTGINDNGITCSLIIPDVPPGTAQFFRLVK